MKLAWITLAIFSFAFMDTFVGAVSLSILVLWSLIFVTYCLIEHSRARIARPLRKAINYGVLVFYRYQRHTLMVKKDVCPLCHRSGLRCRVTINPVTGMRSHVSIILQRERAFRARRFQGV